MNNIKFIAFGDSFINTFSTLTNENFKVFKFKASTMKGIINKNENYKKILNKLENNKYDYGIFCFGQVDFFFSYYFKKYLEKDDKTLEKMYNYAEDYVKVISNLKNIKNKIILGVLPNHIANENYKKFLIGYGIFTIDNINLVSDEDIDYISRNSIIIQFNILLSKYCKIYNIIFCNVYNNLIDSSGYLHNCLLLKHNELNVHINYEILLLVYLKKCLNFLLKFYDINKIYKIMEIQYNKYIRPKNLGPSFNFNKKKIVKFIKSL
jgi:hypothetical protein